MIDFNKTVKTIKKIINTGVVENDKKYSLEYLDRIVKNGERISGIDINRGVQKVPSIDITIESNYNTPKEIKSIEINMSSCRLKNRESIELLIKQLQTCKELFPKD